MLATQFGAQRPHHPHRGGLLFRAVSTCCRPYGRLFLRHYSILVFKVRSLQYFQGDSVSPSNEGATFGWLFATGTDQLRLIDLCAPLHVDVLLGG